MKSKLSLLLVLLLCAGVAMFAGEKKKEFKIPYEKYKLENGMNVILHTDKSDPIASVYIVYHVGSGREVKGRTGFAHFFEHLRFNESQNIPQGQWFSKLQTAGASMVNGSTNRDRTNYFQTVPKNALEMTLWMESDRMGFLLSKFNEETFNVQQNVVQNEKRQGDNRPYAQSQYMMTKLLYGDNHPYGHTVIGELEDLANASLQDAIDFHDKYYGPSNATLIVAGDFDVAQTKKWIDKYFAEINSSPAPEKIKPMPVTLKEQVRSYYEDNLANAPQLQLVFPSAEQYSKDSYALSFLSRLLAGSKKSPIYKVLVEEKKLAPSAIAYQNSSEFAGEFQISVTAFPNKKLADVEDAIKEAFVRFEKEGFTDKDVERQKAGLEFSFYSSISSILGKAMRMGDYNIFKDSPDFMAEDFKNTMSVTKDDVWRVYNQYIKGKNYVLLSFVPKGKTDLIAPNSAQWIVKEESIEQQGTKKKEFAKREYKPIPSKIDRSKEPVKGPDPVVNLPKIWKDKTNNGIEIYGIKHSELPLVQFSIILDGGMLLDDPQKIGAASLTARMLNEGTKNKTAVELREAIQDLGANISVQGGSENISVSGSCLVSKLPEVLALTKEILFEPRWDEKEFALAKSQTIEQLKRSQTAPASIASGVFDKLIYGNENILANQSAGTVETVDKITIDDLKSFYEKNFSPSAAKIMIVGDITKEKAVTEFNILKDWAKKNVVIPEVKIASVTKPGVYFVDIPNAKQSEFRIGHLGLKVSDPDYYKTIIMNHKLGGDFGSVLNMILREKKSFTYGARSGFSGTKHPGYFQASSAIQGNATFESAQIFRDEIAKYRDGISKEDLDLVKSTLLKSFSGRFETLMQLGSMLVPVVQYNLPMDYIAKRQTEIQKMTNEELKSLAQKYIQPEKMIYLVVGDKATQFDKLKDLGLGEPVLLDKDGKLVK